MAKQKKEEVVDKDTMKMEKMADKAVLIAVKQLMASTDFKKARLARIAKYYALYNGHTSKKLRQLFNIPIPVFAGMMDTLDSQYDTSIQLKFQEGGPEDYFKVKKINGAFQMEIASTAENTKWDSKLRTARSHGNMTGRAIVRYDVESDPEYKSELSNVPLKDFHFQPKGGGSLEKHLFAGQEGIQKTKDELVKGAKSGIYNKTQVAKIIEVAADGDYLPASDPMWGDKLERFKPLGLNPDESNYVGEPIYSFVDWILRINGERYYLCFDPWSLSWIRFEKWKNMRSSGLYPWKSYATHEDDENFLSKSFADDLYVASDAIIGMFNQEMTNREKKNNNPKAFDKDMFTDVRRLDEVMHRPDGLIPADTKGGTRRISEGVYEFKVADLGSGTVNLIDWLSNSLGKHTGANDLAMGAGSPASKKASVTFAEQKSVSKRVSWRSAPFQQMMSALGKDYIYGLKDHMPAKMGIRLLGQSGWDWDEITRLDLDIEKDVDVIITSTDKQIADSELKSEKRKNILAQIGADPALASNANPQWRLEEILRTGEWKDEEIAVAMDVKSYANKKALAHAAESIQMILQGEKPKLWFGANIAFIQKIIDFAVDNRSTLADKYEALIDYASSHEELAMANIERQVQEEQRMGTGAFAPAEVEEDPKVDHPGMPGGMSRAIEVGEGAV